MTSITANLSPAQRRLMNVLLDTGHAADGLTSRRAARLANIDVDSLVGLALADLVEARTVDRGELIDIPGARTAVYRGGVILRLTNLGITWACENPLNRLLRALDAAPHGRFSLRDASHSCDDDAVIVGAVTEGYATLHYRGDLRETKFGGHGGGVVAYELRHGDDFVLFPTRKIRTVLGPKS